MNFTCEHTVTHVGLHETSPTKFCYYFFEVPGYFDCGSILTTREGQALVMQYLSMPLGILSAFLLIYCVYLFALLFGMRVWQSMNMIRAWWEPHLRSQLVRHRLALLLRGDQKDKRIKDTKPLGLKRHMSFRSSHKVAFPSLTKLRVSGGVASLRNQLVTVRSTFDLGLKSSQSKLREAGQKLEGQVRSAVESAEFMVKRTTEVFDTRMHHDDYVKKDVVSTSVVWQIVSTREHRRLREQKEAMIFQVECEASVSFILGYVRQEDLISAKQQCALLVRKLRHGWLDLSLPVMSPQVLLTTFSAVMQEVLSKDISDLECVLGVVEVMHECCKAVFFRQIEDGIALEITQKQVVLLLAVVYKSKFSQGTDASLSKLVHYHLTCITECLLFVRDTFSLRTAIELAFRPTAPYLMLALLNSEMAKFKLFMGPLNPVPFYMEVLHMDKELRCDSGKEEEGMEPQSKYPGTSKK